MVSRMKLPFSYIVKEVDKLYDIQFDPNDKINIEKQIQFIGEYLLAVGWTHEEYIAAVLGEQVKKNKNDNSN